jgi:regulator-associated protein of mTOR
MTAVADSPSATKLRPSPSEAQLKQEESKIIVKSTFYDWSCEYFREPQMTSPENDEPGSVKFSERQWRLNRNLSTNQEVVSMYSSAGIHHSK